MARQKRRGGGGARPIKVGEQIRQALSEILREGVLKDPRLSSGSLVTITDVKMTPDLRSGRAFVSIYGSDADDVVGALNDASKVVQREIADRLELRYTPKVDFARDDSIAYGAKIEKLLHDIESDERGAREAVEDE
jgi:ribosome-binding factor A